MFGISFLVLFAIAVWYTWKGNPKLGVGTALMLAFAVPRWAHLGYQQSKEVFMFGDEGVDLRIAISFVGLFLLLFDRKSVLPLRFHRLDLLVLCMATIHIVSDSLQGGFTFALLLRAFGEWCLPYLVGRMVFCNIADVTSVLTVASLVCVVLAVFGTLEMLTGYNLMEWVYDPRPEEGASREMTRWGYRRAYGPCLHPLYFGVMQFVLMPWTIYAATRTVRTGHSKWRLVTPVVSVVGIASSLSRGPVLAVPVLIYLLAILKSKRLRYLLIVAGIISVCVMYYHRDTVIRVSQDTINEQGQRWQNSVIINGEEVALTSTTARMILIELYKPAMNRAGWLGFGTDRVSEFPPRVPVGQQDAETLKLARNIDNIFVLMILRFGYAGALVFTIFGIVTVYCFAVMALTETSGTVFYSVMAAAVATTMLLMCTVWMPHDFGFIFIMYSGIAAGIQSRLNSRPSRGSSQSYESNAFDGGLPGEPKWDID